MFEIHTINLQQTQNGYREIKCPISYQKLILGGMGPLRDAFTCSKSIAILHFHTSLRI